MSLRESGASTRSFRVRETLEFLALQAVINALAVPPRWVARRIGAAVGSLAYKLLGRLKSVGRRNLELAMPELPAEERERILLAAYRNLGFQLAEFCRMARYTRTAASRFIRYEGMSNFTQAQARGRGVLVLTGHLGAWELSSFYHSLMGHPMDIVIRRLDNSLIDEYTNRIRCLHGNSVLHKDDFARGLISAMRAGRTVGILMDTNMTPPQGVFVPFFGMEACTAAGMARVAQKTGAAVLPGFLLWEKAEKRYVLHFGEELILVHTADPDADALANTALFTSVLERYIRAYPEQWLWMHRRWKTRPAGEKGLYS